MTKERTFWRQSDSKEVTFGALFSHFTKRGKSLFLDSYESKWFFSHLGSLAGWVFHNYTNRFDAKRFTRSGFRAQRPDSRLRNAGLLLAKRFCRAKFWAKFPFWRGAVRGEVFREVCGEVFHEVFGLVLLGHSDQKNFSENLRPKFPWVCTVKLAKFQWKTSWRGSAGWPSPRTQAFWDMHVLNMFVADDWSDFLKFLQEIFHWRLTFSWGLAVEKLWAPKAMDLAL